MKIIKERAPIRTRKSMFFWLFSAIIITASVFFYSYFNSTPVVSVFNYSAKISAPSVNIPSCYSTKPIRLQLTNTVEGGQIYYTLDGTEPTANSFVYNGEIYINEVVKKDPYLATIPTSPRWKPSIGDVFNYTVLRAVCVDSKGNKGKELKASYIIDITKQHHYSIPVMSLIFNPDDLFGYKNGIYVMGKTYEDKDNYIKKKIRFDIPWWQYPANYLQRGKDSERNVFVDYFCLDKTVHNSFSTTIRIHGYNTRGFAQKSLRISMNPSLLQDKDCIRILSAHEGVGNYILRNGGNDWTKTLIRDAFIHEAMKGSSLSPQAYQPVVCFFNGEYWGIHTLRERFDELYVQNKYGISKDSIAILELEGDVLIGSKSESRAFKNTVAFILEHDMSVPENYAIAEKEIDIQNLIDYTITNIYFSNNDWPTNNLKYWRYSYPASDSAYRDNRWRFVLSDMDWAMGFNIDNAYEYDMFKFIKDKKSFGIMIDCLFKNPKFKNIFIDSFELKLNSVLKSEHLSTKLSIIAKELSPLMDEHINRWRVIGNKNEWNKNIAILQDFLEKRSFYIKKQLNEYKVN